MDWTDHGQDRRKWRTLVNHVMNLQVHKIPGSSLVALKLMTPQLVLSSVGELWT